MGVVLALVRTRCGLDRYSTGCGASVCAVLDGSLKRVILAGEAAHLFLPFGGGRGLNFGIPDAVASRRPSARQTMLGDSEEARAAVERAAVERHAEACFNQDAAGTALDRREGST